MYRPETTPHSKTQFLAIGLLVFICLAGCASKENKAASADQSQQTFASADQAVSEAVNALRANDRAALNRILGPETDELLDSGDEVADRNRIQKFLALYDEKHQLQPGKDGEITLVVGKTDWPMPIPLIKEDTGKWRFDTEAGKEEMLNRRIGQIVSLTDVKDRLATLGFGPLVGTPEDLAAHIKAESAEWSRIMREANININ